MKVHSHWAFRGWSQSSSMSCRLGRQGSWTQVTFVSPSSAKWSHLSGICSHFNTHIVGSELTAILPYLFTSYNVVTFKFASQCSLKPSWILTHEKMNALENSTYSHINVIFNSHLTVPAPLHCKLNASYSAATYVGCRNIPFLCQHISKKKGLPDTKVLKNDFISEHSVRTYALLFSLSENLQEWHWIWRQV